MRTTARKIVLGVLVLVLLALVLPQFLKRQAKNPRSAGSGSHQYLYDEARIIPDAPLFELYMETIFQESDVDIRIVFVKDLKGKSLEDLAVEKVQAMKIGGTTRESRGVLLLYDVTGRRLRVEVGYGLEGYFPDAFVSYLVHDHARAYFASSDLSLGLKLLLRLLHFRIREAILGNDFDPRVVTIIRQQTYLSGGAGVTTSMPLDRQQGTYFKGTVADEERQGYAPQLTPEAVYHKYLTWLAAGKFDPTVKIFTENSQRYLASLPMSRAYFQFILLQEYGRKYTVDSRGDVAILYFTNTPLVSPHFFAKGTRGWQLDIAAEVANTEEVTGLPYTWRYRGRGDVYTTTFADKLVKANIGPNIIRIPYGDNRTLPVRVPDIVRIADGDNRKLPIRGLAK